MNITITIDVGLADVSPVILEANTVESAVEKLYAWEKKVEGDFLAEEFDADDEPF